MWYFLLFAALLGADQLIKYWTVEHLALGESAAFWPGVMRLTRVHNYGAAWSSFSGQTAALAVVTVLLMQVSAEWLVRMVSGSSEALVLENGARYLRWTSPFYAVLGVLLSTRYALQSLGEKVLPLFSSVIELVGKVIFVLVFIPKFQYNAVILCEPIIWCFMAAYLVAVYRRDAFVYPRKNQ